MNWKELLICRLETFLQDTCTVQKDVTPQANYDSQLITYKGLTNFAFYLCERSNKVITVVHVIWLAIMEMDHYLVEFIL